MDEWRVIKAPAASIADVLGPFPDDVAARQAGDARFAPGGYCLWLIRHPFPGHRRRPLALPAPDVNV